MPLLPQTYMSIRFIVPLCVLIALISTANAQSWINTYDDLLQKYTTEKGVTYKAWKKNDQDLKRLDDIAKQLASNPVPDTNDAAELAYYANAYNIFILQGVLSAYPIKSVKEIASNFGFFSQERFVLAGKKISLNHLEKQLMIKQFKDARIHFIINCASASCPPLPHKAMTAENLDSVMIQSTKSFLDSTQHGINPLKSKTYQISSLFDWYKKDFEHKDGSVLNFINRYRSKPLPAKASFQYFDYDWGLNEAP